MGRSVVVGRFHLLHLFFRFRGSRFREHLLNRCLELLGEIFRLERSPMRLGPTEFVRDVVHAPHERTVRVDVEAGAEDEASCTWFDLPNEEVAFLGHCAFELHLYGGVGLGLL